MEKTLTTVGLWVMAVLTVAPLALVAVAALTPASELITGFQVPSHITLGNLARAWSEGNFGTYMWSSVIVTSSVVILVTILSVLAGYSLGTLHVPGGSVIIGAFVLGLIIPEEALVIPLYYRMRDLGLIDTYWALILPETALTLPFGVYWMWGFFRNVPRPLWESAQLDGASSLEVLWHVLLPLARPPILTLVVLAFVWNWNEFLLPLIMVTSDQLRTAPLGLSDFQGRYGQIDTTGLAAASLIIALPILIVYVALQRRIITGLTSGSIKG